MEGVRDQLSGGCEGVRDQLGGGCEGSLGEGCE